MTNKKTNAFSLLELAIVMIIIGLLAVGITGGQRLIKKANLSRARMFTSSSPVPAIDGLELWLESSLEDSLTMSGAGVTTWVDLSSNNNNAVQLTDTSMPTVVKNDDGLPFVTFNGTSNSMATSDASIGIYTIFIVANIASDSAAAGSVFDTSDSIISANYMINKTADGANWVTYRTNGIAGATGDIFTDGLGIYGFIADEIGADDINIMVSQAGVWAKGGVAEVIVYNRSLDEDEISDIEEYLSKKYKITLG